MEGKYFASLLCEVEIQPLPPIKQNVGVDLGIKHFATLSNGDTPIENPKYLRKYEAKLARWQRILSRRKSEPTAGTAEVAWWYEPEHRHK
jgi:putative transposase